MTIEVSENTPIIKKCKKSKKHREMKNVLKQEFPNCFKSGTDKQPLKVGIHLQLHFHYKDDPRFGPELLQQALNSYCSSVKYQLKIVEGATRVDLYGNQAGEVTAEDAAVAAGRIKMFMDDRQRKLDVLLAKQVKNESPEIIVKREPIVIPTAASSKLKPKVAQLPVKTKEEIKNENRERYAKKMAKRKDPSMKGR